MLNEKQQQLLDQLVERYPKLEQVRRQITDAYELLAQCYAQGG